MGDIKPVKHVKIKTYGREELSGVLGTLPHTRNRDTDVTVAVYGQHGEP